MESTKTYEQVKMLAASEYDRELTDEQARDIVAAWLESADYNERIPARMRQSFDAFVAHEIEGLE